MRLAARIAATTWGGAPTGATAVRLSGAIAIWAVGSGAGGGVAEKPPVAAVWALASPAASSMPRSTATSAAKATVRPRTGMVNFTVSGLQRCFAVRFRGELTGSRWKILRYAVPMKAGDSPQLPGSPGRRGSGPRRFSGYTD